jgi:hypothetical protein
MKLVRLIKMCLDETYSKVRIGKHLSDSFLIYNGLKQGDALSPLFFNFALEYTIRKVQENQVGLKLNGTHQLLDYADDVNLLGDDIDTKKKITETLIGASKEVGLEINVFENRVLRRIFGPKRDEVTGEWRKLHGEELRDLYSSPSIIRIIKWRRLRWAGDVARMGEKRSSYRLLVGKREVKRPLGRPRRRWVDNIRMDLGEVGSGDVDWIGLAQDMKRWKTLVNSVLNLRVP